MVYALLRFAGVMAPIKHVVLLETFCVAAITLLLAVRGITAESIVCASCLPALLTAAYTDVVSYKIYNKTIVLIALISVVNIIYGFNMTAAIDRIGGLFIGAGFFYLVAVVSYMGGGDIKLMGALGLLTGVRGILLITAVSFVLASLYLAVMLLTKKRSKRDKVFLAPFVALGAYVYFLCSSNLALDSYIQHLLYQ